MKRRLSSTGRSPWPLMSTSWWWILECPEDACGLLHQVLGAHDHHPKEAQTWDLSKILHCRIFRPKILHSQSHLISTVLEIKHSKNEWKWRNLHHWQKFSLPPAVTAWTNATSGLAGVSLCASSAQFGRGKWLFFVTDTQTHTQTLHHDIYHYHYHHGTMVPQPLQLLSSASSSSETASNRCMELIDPNWPFALVSSLATCQRHLWTSVSQNLMYTQYLFRFSFSHVRVTFENLFSFPCPVSFPKSLFTVPFSYSLLQFIFERSLLNETLFKPNFILIFCFQLPSSNPRC